MSLNSLEMKTIGLYLSLKILLRKYYEAYPSLIKQIQVLISIDYEVIQPHNIIVNKYKNNDLKKRIN